MKYEDNNIMKGKNICNKNLTLEFLINNLRLEGMNMTKEEILICKKILEGKIDLEEYKKAVLE